MLHWPGRAVTGTRVVPVDCFSLFALVSMPYEVAAVCSIGFGRSLTGTRVEQFVVFHCLLLFLCLMKLL